MPLLLLAGASAPAPATVTPPPPTVVPAPPLFGPSDRRPDGGYITPLMPPTYLRDTATFGQMVAPMDGALDTVRAGAAAVQAAHLIDAAEGDDLARLAARLGLRPYPGEGNLALRARMRATARHGADAASKPRLRALLAEATGLAVVVVTDNPGHFDVTFAGVPPQGLGVVDIITDHRAAGTRFSARAQVTASDSRLGTFRLGERRLGA